MKEKRCPKCGRTLPIECFGIHRQRRDGVAIWCKECNRQSVARLRATPEGKEKHRIEELERNRKNSEAARARARTYYANNRDVAKERNLEAGRRRYAESAEYRANEKRRGQEWARNNPGLVSFRNRSNRLKRRRAMPEWLNAIQRAQIQEFYEIAVARSVQTGIVHHVDHIFAIHGQGWSGLHVPWNLQVLTGAENDKKGIKVPKEFEHMLWNSQKNLRSHV